MSQTIKPEPSSSSIFELVNAMESDVGVMRDGTKAIAIISEVLRDTEKPAYNDLEETVVWIAHRLEELGQKLHDKWEEANKFAFDITHPEFAAQRKAKGKNNET